MGGINRNVVYYSQQIIISRMNNNSKWSALRTFELLVYLGVGGAEMCTSGSTVMYWYWRGKRCVLGGVGRRRDGYWMGQRCAMGSCTLCVTLSRPLQSLTDMHDPCNLCIIYTWPLYSLLHISDPFSFYVIYSWSLHSVCYAQLPLASYTICCTFYTHDPKAGYAHFFFSFS